MTNATAALVALLIAALLLADHQWNQSHATLFAARRFVELVHGLTFWR